MPASSVPAPAVELGALTSGGASESAAPAKPVLPCEAAVPSYGEQQTETLMRSIVAYNKYHVQRVTQQDSRWFKGWQDVDVHEQQPLTIRKPDSKDDLLTYVSPWKKDEAMISFQGTGTYKAGGNVFWLDPFVERSRPKLWAIAGDPPLWSTVLEAAESYTVSALLQDGMAKGTESAAKEARIKFPHVFTAFAWDVSRYDAEHFSSSLPLVAGHVGLWGYHLALMRALTRWDTPAW